MRACFHRVEGQEAPSRMASRPCTARWRGHKIEKALVFTAAELAVFVEAGLVDAGPAGNNDGRGELGLGRVRVDDGAGAGAEVLRAALDFDGPSG